MNEAEIRKYAMLMQELGLTGLEVKENVGVVRLERAGAAAPAASAAAATTVRMFLHVEYMVMIFFVLLFCFILFLLSFCFLGLPFFSLFLKVTLRKWLLESGF